MGQYYGIERSSEYLAHYGIKGMKWGVRKAIERGNDRALTRQYRKAQRKLRKLNHQSNWFIHDRKGAAWDWLSRRKHLPGKILAKATFAKTRSHIHNAMASDPGDLYMDHRRNKFKEAMNEAFKGTRYDQARLAREANLKKARRSKKKAKIMAKIGVKV